jgi:hypothetical protein
MEHQFCIEPNISTADLLLPQPPSLRPSLDKLSIQELKFKWRGRSARRGCGLAAGSDLQGRNLARRCGGVAAAGSTQGQQVVGRVAGIEGGIEEERGLIHSDLLSICRRMDLFLDATRCTWCRAPVCSGRRSLSAARASLPTSHLLSSSSQLCTSPSPTPSGHGTSSASLRWDWAWLFGWFHREKKKTDGLNETVRWHIHLLYDLVGG